MQNQTRRTPPTPPELPPRACRCASSQALPRAEAAFNQCGTVASGRVVNPESLDSYISFRINFKVKPKSHMYL